ncbi:hypothetical protein C2G38_2227573 [Gigaspora rosea]|uniref:F-box domain-containing protein n=1 Tax=Gigaspora rosea TaxID=44941 RepID=A0A397TWW9_9GLOM|nr:hypothetical protein C2G38_2227573 [Gigaspora rosea]
MCTIRFCNHFFINQIIDTTFFVKQNRIQFKESDHRANEVKNIHFLTLVLNCFDNPFIFLFVSLVCKLWKQIVETHDFWESFCDQLGINGPNPHARKYKTYYSIYLKNLNRLCTSCRKDFGERQTSIKKINFKLDVLNDYCIDRMNFYKPTPIFKTRANYKFCKYLTNTIDPWISVDVDFKLCSDCTIQKKEFLFDSINELKDSINRKRKKFKYTEFFYNDVIRIVLRNLYKILNEKDLYIEKYSGVVKNWDFPKNLLYNRDFSYNKKEEENPYAELERASARAYHLAELGIFGNLESNSETNSKENESESE